MDQSLSRNLLAPLGRDFLTSFTLHNRTNLTFQKHLT